jgi:hypothetical protein
MNDDEESRPGRSRNKLVWWLIAGVVVLAGVVWYVLTRLQTDPLPAAVTQEVNYPVYYPKSVPGGYGYKPGSARYDQGIIVYVLDSGAATITVTEQSMPANPPDLSHLTGFTPASVPAGYAAFGQVSAKPSAIILANSTLITLAGTASVSATDVHSIAQSLTAVRINY